MTNDSDLKSVENPGDSQTDDDQQVKPTHTDEAGARDRGARRHHQFGVQKGGTERADSNAPIAPQCRCFLSNLVARSIPIGPRSDLGVYFEVY